MTLPNTKLTIFAILLITIATVTFIYRQGSQLTASTKNNQGDYVVLVHGLGRTSWSMHILGTGLDQKGYRIINVNYPSTTDTIENLANRHLKNELDRHYTDRTKKINFVTHSMGGAMTRYFLEQNKLENLSRVVMIAPPSKGSEAADTWSRLNKASKGPAIHQMTTNPNSLVNQLPPPYYEVGIISGRRDEKVSVENTRLEGMKDFLIVDREHTFIMIAKEVIEATDNFLRSGIFIENRKR